MNSMLKLLGALLAYPEEPMIAALPQLRSLIERDNSLPSKQKSELQQFVSELSTRDLLLCQENYVEIFDRGRTTSLHLFEHVHGESRDRGMAMIDLQKMYESAGLALKPGELPDYLPVVLEYLSTRSDTDAREMLEDCAHILRKIGDALAGRGSRYSAVFAVLLVLANEPGLTPAEKRKPIREEKSLDEEWAEEPVVFGPGASPGCGARQPQDAVIRFIPRGHSAFPGTGN
ncbi:MAG: nitrate reductase molybdenum cofactor assembly chaperone [Burkholderiales bacterium]|jgi:nitrate reductase delta subunit